MFHVSLLQRGLETVRGGDRLRSPGKLQGGPPLIIPTQLLTHPWMGPRERPRQR